MSFSEVFIRRPVLSTVVSLLILFLGVQGIASMSIRPYPKVNDLFCGCDRRDFAPISLPD